MTEVLVELEGSTLWITINRPEKRNALSVGLAGQLTEAIASAGPEVHAIVLGGTPPTFCAGGDLASLTEVAAGGAIAVTDMVYGTFHALVGAIQAAPVPVIAAVEGAALGAGLDLAATCDLRWASDEATFASSWIGVGLVPGMGGAHQLTSLVGAAHAAELVLLGRRIDAATALQWGLVNAVVPSADLRAEVRVVADRLGGTSRIALERSKAALRRARDHGLADELATLGAVQASLITGDDFRRATERFIGRDGPKS